MSKINVYVSIPAKHAFTAVEDRIVNAAGEENQTGAGTGFGRRDLDFAFSPRNVAASVKMLEKAIEGLKGAKLRVESV